MNRRFIDLPLGYLVRLVLGRLARADAGLAARRRARGRTRVEAPPAPRGRLALVSLGLLGLGFALLVPFEAWFTKLAGVLALFAFIGAGVWAIASPGLLDRDEEEGTS